jgi:hypothetical protein
MFLKENKGLGIFIISYFSDFSVSDLKKVNISKSKEGEF